MFRYKMGFVFLLFIVLKDLAYSFKMKVKTIINCDFFPSINAKPGPK